MELQKSIYFTILLVFIAIPFFSSKKINHRYLLKFKYFIPTFLLTGAIFILWDRQFTDLDIWKFNPEYTLGIKILNLPIEEWLFFFTFPFFSLHLYEMLTEKSIQVKKLNIFVIINLVLLVFFGLITYFCRNNLYAFFTFFLLTIYFGYTVFRNNFKRNFPNFYLSFLLALIPYLILRELLTSLPVITFNDTYLLKIFIFSVPVEDIGFFFLLHLMNVTIYDYLKVKQFY